MTDRAFRADRQGEKTDHSSNDSGPRSNAWVSVGVLFVLLIAWLWTFQGLIEHPPGSWVPRYASLEQGPELTLNSHVLDTDQGFVAWLVSRNARTWTESPARIFDGEICHPTPQSLAFGEPALTLGLLAMPAWWFTGDPLWTYNSVVWILPLFSAFVMFLVVKSWTGNALAAGVAALLYGFHSARLSDPTHLYVPDTVWTLLALFFFRRWLLNGRWGDVSALGGAISLQIGGSLYPLIAGASVGLPFAIWGFSHLGVKRTRPLQWATLVVLLGAVLYAAFSPALSMASNGDLMPRNVQVFLPWSTLWSDLERKLGFWLWGLPLLALWPQSARPVTSLRWALLAGALLALALATGGNVAARHVASIAGEPPPWALPNLYAALASVLPGLDVVRLPASIAYGAYLALALLAGLGVAEVLKRLPPRAHWAFGSLVLGCVFLSTIRPGWSGDQVFAYKNLRPERAELAFFDRLAASGDQGPVLELPMEPGLRSRDGLSILVAAYHTRPTSACYNSFLPQQTRRVQTLAAALPEVDAIQSLHGMGFRTVVLHHNVYGKNSDALLHAMERAAGDSGGGLIRIESDGERTAFRLRPKEPGPAS